MFSNIDWKTTAIAVAVGIALLTGYRAIFPRDPYNSPIFAIRQGQMPICDSAPVRHLLRHAIEQSPAATQEGLKLLKLGDFTYVGEPNPIAEHDSAALARKCTAVVFTNIGRGVMLFTISWADNSKATLLLEVAYSTL